ncbi:MAG: nicotinate (nicotinamide) nucleotide adenylyltransferase [Muribaculaceae bacterium]|nr:nicotinate (nicotinamide) nucleotide adenylyltransferase [Muribaculaceae bacterium]
MTIGIYGGSFDPIHTGHAMVANFVSQCNVVDEVWIMVSRQNPLKPHATIAGDLARLEMAELVAQNCKNVKVSDIEIRRPLPSFTYDTLCELKKLNPEKDFKLIIGSDSLANFDKWKKYDLILENFGVIVYPRPGFLLPETEPEGMTFLNGAPEFSISSSLIREYIASGWDINFFVPLAVSSYIKKHRLYL